MNANVLDVVHVIGHIFVLIYHYYLMFLPKEDPESLPIITMHLSRLSIMVVFSVFFVINGLNSGQRLTQSLESQNSFLIISIEFILNRVVVIIAISYLFYISFALFIFFIVKDVHLEIVLFNGLVSNLLFYSNFTTENNV